MYPEDRLDALLSALRPSERGPRAAGGQASLDPRRSDRTPAADEPRGEDGELAPLLEAARQVQSLHAEAPDPRFAEALRTRLLARAAERREEHLGNTVPAVAARGRRNLPLGLPRRLALPLRPSLVAAAALLAVLSVGTLIAAAAAPPGSPLFGLHRAEQGLRVAAASGSTEKAQLLLQYARNSLSSVRDTAAQHRDASAYQSALDAMRADDKNAATAIAAVPAGSARQTLDAKLGQLHTDERATLTAALAALTWPERIETTQALDDLGALVPRITGVTLTAHQEDAWQITITGSGFQPGAVLLINEQAAGGGMLNGDGQFVAQVAIRRLEGASAAIGIGNPDGTAADAATSAIHILATPRPEDHNEHGTPSPGGDQRHGTATATPGGSEHEGTPTPG